MLLVYLLPKLAKSNLELHFTHAAIIKPSKSVLHIPII